MALSHRGQVWASMAADLLIWKVLKDLWDPETNPDGFVSLGVAENALMHEELNDYIHKNLKLSSTGLTYGDGGAGSKALRSAVAQFLTRKLKPATAIEASHVCVTNGVSCGIEHLSSILADKGDAFLLGQPHYGAFIDDIELRPETEVVRVFFGDVDPLSLSAVSAYETSIESCKAKGQKVAGLMLCNPHNPLGRCYPREYIIELMKLCQKHQVHLISDEIYAMSVFRTPESPDEAAVPFTSLSSIPTEGLIDPALTHILWGLSKDFGANGLRLGVIVSQHNLPLHEALVPVVIYSYASSLAEAITTTLLSDDDFTDWYLAENHKRLNEHYKLVVAWAERHNIRYAKGVNAAFFLWVNLGTPYSDAVQQNRIQAASDEDVETTVTDAHVNKALLQEKVFLASGSNFGSERPGWFRIVFSQKKENLLEGLSRIERALRLTG